MPSERSIRVLVRQNPLSLWRQMIGRAGLVTALLILRLARWAERKPKN